MSLDNEDRKALIAYRQEKADMALDDAVIREDTTTPGLQAAREKLAYMSMTEQEQREYRDYMVSVHAAKDAWDTAIDEAKAEGRTEGEHTKALDSARKMKADGMPAELIVKYSGLKAEEIESL